FLGRTENAIVALTAGNPLVIELLQKGDRLLARKSKELFERGHAEGWVRAKVSANPSSQLGERLFAEPKSRQAPRLVSLGQLGQGGARSVERQLGALGDFVLVRAFEHRSVERGAHAVDGLVVAL